MKIRTLSGALYRFSVISHLQFQVSTEQYGHVKTVDLKPGGANIPVTNENRKGNTSRALSITFVLFASGIRSWLDYIQM